MVTPNLRSYDLLSLTLKWVKLIEVRSLSFGEYAESSGMARTVEFGGKRERKFEHHIRASAGHGHSHDRAFSASLKPMRATSVKKRTNLGATRRALVKSYQ